MLHRGKHSLGNAQTNVGISNQIMLPLRTVAIKNFLKSHTHPDLAALYNHDMEVQINVGQDGGQIVEGDIFEGTRWRAWTDGIQTWKPIRIPRNAMTEPVYSDVPMSYDLDRHAEGIGMTGWDWVNKVSRWVAYDFDAITGHSDKHAKKLTDVQLLDVRKAVENVPWISLRSSTSGKGLHLYVFLKETFTKNHTEHAALGRAILHMLSGITGFDFNSKVDACGGNMWVWHRKMVGTTGLTIEKLGSQLDEIPANWRDHIGVINKRSGRNLPKFVESLDIPDAERAFNELTGQRPKMPLDQIHKDLFAYFTENKCLWWWDADHHMLVTHTIHLKEAHDALGYKGQFETLATGEQRGYDHNCFAFPLIFGAWAVRRYSHGTAESKTWDQDGKGWTRCYLNREIDLTTAARTHDAVEHPNGGWHFREASQAQAALLKLGADIQLPPWIMNRATKIHRHNKEDGKVVVSIPEEDHDKPEEMVGWLKERKQWKRVYMVNVIRATEPDVGINSDEVIRHLINMDGTDHGWVVKADGVWHYEPLQHVQAALSSLGLSPKEGKEYIGAQIFQPWKLINIPFTSEYPGDRQWNRDGAQLRFLPNPDKDNLSCPTWDKILNHIGKGLDDAVRYHGWCISNGIVKGSEYLKCWIASLFKEPTEPLPYLFLWSDEQNVGKTILHEALRLLLTRGVMRVDHALANPSGFNGEMENAVLCTIEEIDLKRNIIAYNRIKDWVTSKTISIHKKGKTPYMAVNCTHFIQTANSASACPIFPGDTRITMVNVSPLDPAELIPMKQMMILLEKEASHFIAEIMKLELPLSNDRLNVPVLMTSDKFRAEESNETDLETFLKEVCHFIPGAVVSVADMYNRFREWLDPNASHMWTKIRMGKLMPSRFPKGRLTTTPSYHYGNISFDPTVLPGKLLKSDRDVLRPSEEAIHSDKISN